MRQQSTYLSISQYFLSFRYKKALIKYIISQLVHALQEKSLLILQGYRRESVYFVLTLITREDNTIPLYGKKSLSVVFTVYHKLTTFKHTLRKPYLLFHAILINQTQRKSPSRKIEFYFPEHLQNCLDKLKSNFTNSFGACFENTLFHKNKHALLRRTQLAQSCII